MAAIRRDHPCRRHHRAHPRDETQACRWHIGTPREIPVEVEYASLPETLGKLNIEPWRKEFTANVISSPMFPLCRWNPIDELEIEASLLEQLDGIDQSDQMLFESLDEERDEEDGPPKQLPGAEVDHAD